MLAATAARQADSTTGSNAGAHFLSSCDWANENLRARTIKAASDSRAPRVGNAAEDEDADDAGAGADFDAADFAFDEDDDGDGGDEDFGAADFPSPV